MHSGKVHHERRTAEGSFSHEGRGRLSRASWVQSSGYQPRKAPPYSKRFQEALLFPHLCPTSTVSQNMCMAQPDPRRSSGGGVSHGRGRAARSVPAGRTDLHYPRPVWTNSLKILESTRRIREDGGKFHRPFHPSYHAMKAPVFHDLETWRSMASRRWTHGLTAFVGNRR
uniref:Uncharacterized protein TCIL3000_5_5350 n=1 Tax=Trypanosoma congolense (strain IL3000) TaxID=1068625 RepID=G0UMA6_TRYCI|nr:unnamed protein product [Trypanosoma congolense IL3000]